MLNIYKTVFLPLFLIIFFAVNANSQLITGRIQLPFKVDLSQDNQKIKVDFKLERDSYLYKDSISIDGLPNSKINFPTSISKLDKFSNKRRDVYDRSFSLSVNLKDLKIKNNEINLIVKYQGCTSKVCFLPQKKNLKLSFKKK